LFGWVATDTNIAMPLKAEPGETIDEFRGAFFTMNDAKVRIVCGITRLALVQLAASRKSVAHSAARCRRAPSNIEHTPVLDGRGASLAGFAFMTGK
jgi:hypothetical protein